jgi:hypothetical protein
MADYFTEAMKQYGSQLPTYQAGVAPLQSYYTDILKGGPSMLAAMSPEIDAASQQFQQAIRNVQGSAFARGGALQSSLANLEAGRASTIAQLLGRARPWAAGQLQGLLSNQQSLGLNALAAAQRADLANRQLSYEKWKGVGGGIMDILRTPIGRGGSSPLGTLLGKIPGLGGGAAAAGGGAAAAIGGGGLDLMAADAGVIGGGGGGLAATGVGHALGLGGGSGLLGLGSATIPVVGGLVGAGILGKKIWEKSQVHPQANQWVQGFQNPFDQAMANIDTAGMPQVQADALRKQYMTDYLSRLQEFSKQGGHQKIVADQAINTFKQWYSGHANRLGVQIPGATAPAYGGQAATSFEDFQTTQPLERY